MTDTRLRNWRSRPDSVYVHEKQVITRSVPIKFKPCFVLITMSELQDLLEQALTDVADADDENSLDKVRVRYLGKWGKVTERLKQLGSLPQAQRPIAGQLVNQAKQQLQVAIDLRKTELQQQQLTARLAKEKIDVTLPARGQSAGGLHPVTLTLQEIERLFVEIGFTVVDGPEIEDDYHNFTALNIPEHHPARTMHDTFYCNDGLLLRTHTSNVQIRYMNDTRPPLRVIAPGRVYRCDSDMTHTPMFHQVEGIMVDEGVTFAHLKGVLEEFAAHIFGSGVDTRFRPSYFPFTRTFPRKWIFSVTTAGLRYWDAAWCIPRFWKTSVLTAGDIPGLPSAWGWSASPCCATASMISACFLTTTCGFYINLIKKNEIQVIGGHREFNCE